ncbi:MAG: hypothetical protein WBN94_02925 [Methanothrix sp.]
MATADVLRKIVNKLEDSAVEIESKSREMFKGAKLNAIPGRDLNIPGIGPTYSWEEPNNSDWQELQRSVTRKYQKWYLVALNLVKEYAPESLPDFTSLYKSDNSFSSAYNGFFNALWMKTGESNGNANMVVNRYMDLFEKQRSILSSIPDIAETKELDLRRIISADLVVSELEHADRIYREHKREPCERAACVLAGVALERHLKTWCEVCLIPLSTDKKPTLNTLIDALYNGGNGHIDLTQKNQLDVMASIRNNCAHPNAVERSRVGELIQDVRRVLAWPMN